MKNFKFHWGFAITVFIILFIAASIYFLIYSSKQKLSFVEDQYYQKELKFGEKLEKMKNASAIKDKVVLINDEKGIRYHFFTDSTAKTVSGSLHVYRPSDENLDFTIDINLNADNELIIPSEKLHKGKYILKMEWEMFGKTCYREEELIVYNVH